MTDANSQFWLDIAGGSVLPHYFLARFTELAGRFKPSESDQLMDQLDSVLRELKYHTSAAEVFDAHEATRRSEPGYWRGRYALLDDHGDSYQLEMMDGAVALHADTTLLDTFEFGDGVLRIGDDRLAFELSFEQPTATDGEVSETVTRRGQTRCTGRVLLGNGETRVVEGKRGCYTPWAVRRDIDGDYVGTWSGVYKLRYLDTQEWRDDAVSFDPRDGRISVSLGTTACTHVSYINNHLVCRVGGDADNQLGVLFSLDSDGSKGFLGVERKDGLDRPVAGFLTERLPEMRPPDAPRALLATAGTEPIKLTLRTEPNPVTRITDGTERMYYELDVELAGLDVRQAMDKDHKPSVKPDGTPVYELTSQPVLLDDVEANDEPFMPIRQLMDLTVISFTPNRDAATGRVATATALVKLRSTQGETHSAAVYNFRIVQGPKSVRLKFLVFSLAGITISNIAVPPVVRRTQYVATLAASGGRAPYIWNIAAKHLPPGLDVYDDESGEKAEVATERGADGKDHPKIGWVTVRGTPRIEGSVTDIGWAQRASGVPVEVSSSDVSMSPTTETLYFRIVESEQIGGNGTNWTAFVIGGLAGLAVLVDWCIGKYDQRHDQDHPTEGWKALKELKEFFTGNGTTPAAFADTMASVNTQSIADANQRSVDLNKLTVTVQDALAAQTRLLNDSLLKLNNLEKGAGRDIEKEVRRLREEVRDLRDGVDKGKRAKTATDMESRDVENAQKGRRRIPEKSIRK